MLALLQYSTVQWSAVQEQFCTLLYCDLQYSTIVQYSSLPNSQIIRMLYCPLQYPRLKVMSPESGYINKHFLLSSSTNLMDSFLQNWSLSLIGPSASVSVFIHAAPRNPMPRSTLYPPNEINGPVGSCNSAQTLILQTYYRPDLGAIQILCHQNFGYFWPPPPSWRQEPSSV